MLELFCFDTYHGNLLKFLNSYIQQVRECLHCVSALGVLMSSECYRRNDSLYLF